MRRRDFIAFIGGAAAWPVAARAQQRLPMIGYLSARSAEVEVPFLAAFRKGLAEAGYVEGRNVAIEFHFADGEMTRLPLLAAELVARQPAVIVSAGGDRPAAAAKA